MKSGLSSTLMTMGIEPGVSSPIGLLVVLAILAQTPSVQAQSIGGAASRVAAATASQRDESLLQSACDRRSGHVSRSYPSCDPVGGRLCYKRLGASR